MSGKETFDFVPNSFMTPNDYVDKLMHLLTNPELRCLIYSTRRIFGFNKRQDNIAISQFVGGTKRSDGSLLDHGTGLSRQSVITALDSLERIGILMRIAENDPKTNKGAEYALQLDGSKIDYQSLVDRYEIWKSDNAKKIISAREARSTQQTAVSAVYPVDGERSIQQTGGGLSSRRGAVYPIDTQYTDLNTDLNTDNIGRANAPEVEGIKNQSGIVKNPGALAALVAFEKSKGDFDYSIYPEEVRGIIRAFCELFSCRPPHKGKRGGEFAQWISSARELMDACGEFGIDALKASADDYLAMPPDMRYMIAWPGAALKLTRSSAAKLRQKSSSSKANTFQEYDQIILDTFDRHATEQEYQRYLMDMGVRV